MKSLVNFLEKCYQMVLTFAFAFYFAVEKAFAVTYTAPDAKGSGGTKAIGSATDMIIAYLPTIQKLVYAIAGVVIVVSSLVAYFKMNNDDQDTKKTIMFIIGSCIFLIAAVTFLPQVLGWT